MPVTELLSLDDAKANLNITSDAQDEELQDVIDEASDIIEDLTGSIRGKTVIDVFRGVRRRTLLLSEAPVLSVTSVSVAWQGTINTTYTSTDVDLDTVTGEVRLVNGSSWSQDVTVTYVAGRSSVPACVKRAMKEQVRHIWETQRGTTTARPSYDTDQFTQTPSGYLVPNRVAEAVAPVARAPRVG